MYLTLETERLRLRPLTTNDAGFILALVNSEGWLKYIGDRQVSDKKDAQQYIRNILDNPDFCYTVFEARHTGQAMGIITFLKREDEDFPDLGFALLPEYEKKGYALEACQAYVNAITKGDGTDTTILAFTLPGNTKSIALLAKLGFQYTGKRKKGESTLAYYALRK